MTLHFDSNLMINYKVIYKIYNCPMINTAVSVESLERVTDAAVHGAPGRSEGHRLVSSPAWAAGLRRGNGRPLHPLLEHSHGAAAAVY